MTLRGMGGGRLPSSLLRRTAGYANSAPRTPMMLRKTTIAMMTPMIKRKITKSKNRNHIPRVHVYPDHVFIVVHAPEIGTGGHVHYLELDQFVGEDFLVTVHGPLNPKVPLEAALRETDAVAARMDSGRLRPTG